MQRTNSRQAGFHVIELTVALLVLVAVAGGGYTVWHRSHKAKTPVASTNVPAAPQIKTAKDLDTAASTINQLNVSAGTSDLDSLQNDLNAL